jgi:hypothetical protein
MHFLLQQELSKIADDGARKYNEDTAVEDRTPKGIAQAMQSASRKHHKQLYSQFTKHICVADPALGDDFLLQVKLHWENKEKPEMTLEKLQMVATTVVSPEFRVRWLRWWNAGPLVRAGVKFPKAPVSDNKLLQWLNKAAFYAGVITSIPLLSCISFLLFLYLFSSFLAYLFNQPVVFSFSVRGSYNRGVR